MLNYKKQVSSIEINLSAKADKNALQAQIEKLAGNDYEVKNRFQQHELLYKIMKSEKWAVFFILAFILIIATFNIIGSSSMLIIDKQKDIAVLLSMGATTSLIRKIFLAEGMLISFIGAFAGIVIALLICFLQLKFGIINLQGEGSFIIDAYPVNIQFLDIVYVILIVLLIGYVAAWYPAKQLIKKHLPIRQEL